MCNYSSLAACQPYKGQFMARLVSPTLVGGEAPVQEQQATIAIHILILAQQKKDLIPALTHKSLHSFTYLCNVLW